MTEEKNEYLIYFEDQLNRTLNKIVLIEGRIQDEVKKIKESEKKLAEYRCFLSGYNRVKTTTESIISSEKKHNIMGFD